MDNAKTWLGDPPTDRGPIVGVPKDDLDALHAQIEELEAALAEATGHTYDLSEQIAELKAKLESSYRAEALLKGALKALQVIADEKGKCEHCGKIAEGEGRGYVTCDGERDADYQPYYHCRWEAIDPAAFARAFLARIAAQEGKG